MWKYSQFYSTNLFLFVTMNCHFSLCCFSVRCLSVIFVSYILFSVLYLSAYLLVCLWYLPVEYYLSVRNFLVFFGSDIFCVYRLIIFICDIRLCNIIFTLQYFSVLSVCTAPHLSATFVCLTLIVCTLFICHIYFSNIICFYDIYLYFCR
jgi:hypothetical protein